MFDVCICAPTVRTLGSWSNAVTSDSDSGGFLRHLHVASVPSQLSNVIGNRDRENVVGPALSKSFATLSLMP